MRLIYDIIADKRDGQTLSKEDISCFLENYLNGEIKDYQMAALLMAIFFNGLNRNELKIWVEKMLFSGEVLDLSHIDRPVVDKHSTGGVGDKISIPLAPLLAELGFVVPMISGRGLGHTGGTLDKLESIPGFSVNIEKNRFNEILDKNGMLLIGQTPEIAPLDKKLYALRDVTATVESIPLIASSIMSKKLAEGIKGLILDIKIGSGAFMKTIESGTLLAETMQNIGKSFNTKVDVLFSDMSEPLGYSIGNSMEVIESIEIMKGKYVPQVTELVLTMAATLMKSFNMCKTIEDGKETALKKLKSGSVAERFKKTVEIQGGNPCVVDKPEILYVSNLKKDIPAKLSGFLSKVDALSFGKALIRLGGGRLRKEDSINPGVGFLFHKKRGDFVTKGEPVFTVYYSDENSFNASMEYLKNAVEISETEILKRNIIFGSL